VVSAQHLPRRLPCQALLVARDCLSLRHWRRWRLDHSPLELLRFEKVRHLVASIRRRFPRSDVRFLDTVCKPTKERQDAAVELARASDVVIVIGGETSNNTREPVKTCGRHCSRVHHVQTEADLSPAWFREAHTVGITAGTSTPDDVIDRVDGHSADI
jgi:4-hydroxy-3-methylbut-2-enyl diphosphate reductase